MDIKNYDTSPPKALLTYIGEGKFRTAEFNYEDCATLYWLFQDCGETYHLRWWQSGWVVQYQESFLTSDNGFEHKLDIVGFEHSMYGDSDGWKHVYNTREEAVEAFKMNYRRITWSE